MPGAEGVGGVLPPARADGVELLGELRGSGYRRAPVLARRADGQVVQLTPLLSRVLAALDGTREPTAVAAVVSAGGDRQVTGDDVAYLLHHKLLPLGLVRRPDGSQPVTRRRDPLLGLRLRVVLSRPAVTGRLAAALAPLFHPAVALPSLVAFAAVVWSVVVRHGLGGPLEEALARPSLLLLLVALTVVSAAFHELGHAAACHRGGARPGAMGAALYLVWPVFYTDVTDSYRLSRAGRLRVDAGGLYFNALFTLGTVAVAAATATRGLLLLVPVQLLQMLRQLVPLVRFDGYHLLADLVGVPDLFSRIRPVLRSVVPGRRPEPAADDLRPWVRLVVAAWVAVVVPALAVGFGYAAWTLPRVATAAAGSIETQVAVLRDSVEGRALARAGLGLVSILTVALVPLSMGYLVVRVAGRGGWRLWRATADHPVPRVGVAAVAVVLAGAAGASAVLPAGPATPGIDRRPATDVALAPQARPVQPAAAVTTAPEPVLEPASVEEPAPARPARTSSPAPAPASGAREVRPHWPFPFAPPPPPGPGDNQALAVNVRDSAGAFAMDVDLQWLGAGDVLQANRAYALAQCVDCRTLAVAFQALIVDGRTARVAPQNLAVAVNHTCRTCVTEAVSVQLVAVLARPLDPEVRGRVTRHFATLHSLPGRLARLDPADVRARLLTVKAEILAILAPFLEPAATTSASTTAAAQEAPPGAVTPGVTTRTAGPAGVLADATSVETQPAETQPVETQPAELTPGELLTGAAPLEAASHEAAPREPSPSEGPTGGSPVEGSPVEGSPVEAVVVEPATAGDPATEPAAEPVAEEDPAPTTEGASTAAAPAAPA